MPRLDRLVSQAAGLKLSAAREVIERGEVAVDPPGRVITSPSWIVLKGETVTVAGVGRLAPTLSRLVFMNKPAGCVSERRPGKANVYDLVPADIAHSTLGSFGRLDRDTTGLLVLGTDGGLCHLATHPDTHLPKVYTAVCQPNLGLGRGRKQLDIDGLVSDDGVYSHAVACEAFAAGLVLKDGTRCKPATLAWELGGPDPVARVTLSEGKNHQVKRMLAAVGAHVVTLHRDAIGSVWLHELGIAEGDAREATPAEDERFRLMFPPVPKVRDNPDRAG